MIKMISVIKNIGYLPFSFKMKRALQEIKCEAKFDGQKFVVYNKSTKKMIGCIVDKIDWRFIDATGKEYKIAKRYQDNYGKWNSTNQYDIGCAINYFTSLYFLILDLKKGDDIMLNKNTSLADVMCWIWFSSAYLVQRG